MLFRNANTPNSLERIYTEDETGQAFIECMSILNPHHRRQQRKETREREREGEKQKEVKTIVRKERRERLP